MCDKCGTLVHHELQWSGRQQKRKRPQMGMIGEPQREEIHWEDLPLEAFPIVAPKHTEETETETELPNWLNPNTAPAETPELVPVPLKQGGDS